MRKTHTFILRPDGQWVDLMPTPVKENQKQWTNLSFYMGEVKAVFETLGGQPRILELPVHKDGLEKWLDRHDRR